MQKNELVKNARFSEQSSNSKAEQSQLQNLRDEAKSPYVSWIVELCNKDFRLSDYIGLLGQELFGLCNHLHLKVF